MRIKRQIQPSRLTNTRLIALGFLAVILAGSVLLSLPAAARNGIRVPYLTALFTSVSATCVTGLSVADTYSTWSVFGQVVILILIQIGGLGFMSVITMLSVFLHRRVGLRERRLLMESAGTMRISGMIRLIRKIMIGTALFEGTGAVVLAFRFCPRMGLGEGIYTAVFHSVSAFCNAGFDLMGKYRKFSSLTEFCGDFTVNITVAVLIITGGLGFIVWEDIAQNRFNFKKYELHSKLVLSVTAVLTVVPTVWFYLSERIGAFAAIDGGGKWLAAFFQAVTPRTAGFNTVDLGALSENGKLMTLILMLVGGSPGSTAGGIKTTTLAVLLLGAVAASRHTKHITVFKRRLEGGALNRACAVFTVYTAVAAAAAAVLCAAEDCSLYEAVFEAVSAIGTVGLTTGITPRLGVLSDIVLMVLMYGGRVGGLSLMLSLAEKRVNVQLERPCEKVLIG